MGSLSTYRIFIALADIPINGITALLVVSPILYRFRSRLLAITSVAVGVLLDVDHVVKARSLSLEGILSIGGRPITHSLAFAFLLGIVALLLSRRFLGGWVVFAALISHLLRDAAGGLTPILYPLEAFQIPFFYYPAGLVALFIYSLDFSWLFRWQTPP